MKSSPCRAFDVFDFKEEDELPEVAAGRKFLEKFKDSNLDDHAVLKYEFLECGKVPSILPFLFFLQFPGNQNGNFYFDFLHKNFLIYMVIRERGKQFFVFV